MGSLCLRLILYRAHSKATSEFIFNLFHNIFCLLKSKVGRYNFSNGCNLAHHEGRVDGKQLEHTERWKGSTVHSDTTRRQWSISEQQQQLSQ